MPNRICICGDGWGAIAALTGMSSMFKDIVIVSNDSDVIHIAKSKDFPIKSRIADAEADIYICSGFKAIIEKTVLENKCFLNVHFSLLPRFRGLHSTVWSVLNDEPFFGLTVHLMNESIDDGPIVHQYRFANTGQNSREIIERCNAYVAENLSQIVRDFIDSKIEPKPQNRDEATWVTRRNLDDCLIDFDNSVAYLRLFFRALVEPYPLPRIKTPIRTVEVSKSRLIEKNYCMTNGRVVNCEDGQAWIKIADGLLVVSEIRDCSTKSSIDVNEVFKLGMRLQ